MSLSPFSSDLRWFRFYCSSSLHLLVWGSVRATVLGNKYLKGNTVRRKMVMLWKEQSRENKKFTVLTKYYSLDLKMFLAKVNVNSQVTGVYVMWLASTSLLKHNPVFFHLERFLKHNLHFHASRQEVKWYIFKALQLPNNFLYSESLRWFCWVLHPWMSKEWGEATLKLYSGIKRSEKKWVKEKQGFLFTIKEKLFKN